MQKKNIIVTLVILLVTILTFSVGSYAYFVANFKDERTSDNGGTLLKTCNLAEATIVSDIPDAIGSFTSQDIYPGHKEVLGMSVTVSGNIGSSSNFEFVYNVLENNLEDNVKVSVYKTNEVIPTTDNYFECEKVSEKKENETFFYERCKDKSLGKLIKETTLRGGTEEVSLGQDRLVISKNNEDLTKYYYVVIEFLNKSTSQNNVMATSLSGKVTLRPTTKNVTTKYQEDILNGTDPIIKDEFIPVILENDGTVRMADVAMEWYKYEHQEWANAVILKDESKMYCPGEVIPEDDIESYFVWIPKYRYQLWDLGKYNDVTGIDPKKVHTIPVIFGDYNTSDVITGECTTPMESGATKNCQIGDYMTHPAFLSIPSTGFWVGKFETSKGNNNPDNSINPDGIKIKPNVTSWRNINVSNAFYTTYDYKRNLDSHMMKNTEWGAVAYLSHSIYGSHTSVRINNHSNYKTGYASVSKPTCGWTDDNRDCNRYGITNDITLPYNTSTGYLASTTGNITGIYDMAGGGWEYVMGIMENAYKVVLSGQNMTYHSGFSGPYSEGGTLQDGYDWPLNKYYDKYLFSDDLSEYARGYLGDATKEMGTFKQIYYAENLPRNIGSWYHENAYFVIKTYPWFARGANYEEGLDAGVFSFGHNNGAENIKGTFRTILTPTE